MRIQRSLWAIPMTSLALLSCSEKSPSVAQEDHFQADGLVLVNEAFETVVHVWRGKVSDTIHVNAGCVSAHLQIRFLDQDSVLVSPPDEKDHLLGWSFGDSTIAGIHRHDGDIWDFHVEGLKEGSTTLKLSMMHVDHADFSTPLIPVVVDSAVAVCPVAPIEEE